MKKLILDLDNTCPTGLSQSLSKIINLPRLTQLSLNLDPSFASDSYTRTNLINIFKHTSNIHTFEICNNLSLTNSHTIIEDICLLIPPCIRHLKITVKNIHDMKILFERFKYLSSITFRFSLDASIPPTRIIESFLNMKKGLTYKKDDSSIRVWLDEFMENQNNVNSI